MRILIVESDAALANLWARHLRRREAVVHLAASDDEAIDLIAEQAFDVIVLDAVLGEGSAFAVADLASFRQPDARVVFVTGSSFFSDGSIFNHIPNASACLPSGMAPEDVATVVGHYGMVH